MGFKAKQKKKLSMALSDSEPTTSQKTSQKTLAGHRRSKQKKSKPKKSKQSEIKQSHNLDEKTKIMNDLLDQIEECYEFEASFDFKSALREHFDRFPARYWLDSESRVYDVFTHMTLLDLAKDASGPVFNTAPFKDFQFKDLDAVEIDSSENLVNPFGKNRHTHEIQFSYTDRPELLPQLMSMLWDIGLNIKETCSYSTSDGYSLILFLVDDWPYEGNAEPEIGLEKQSKDTSGSLRALIDQRTNLTDPLLTFVVVPNDDVDVWEININQLKVGDKVAVGSFGTVYKGIYFNQEVAVKVPKPERFNADMLREFTQEIFIMRKIRHKNVVQFIGACTQSPILCIITEFMSRGSLYDFLHKLKSKFDLTTLLKVAIDVSKGMDCLHQNGIIHRDLKSSNLLMDENEVVKVADFGVARLDTHCREMTPERGTYIWMAPEVIEHKSYNHKADIFSFGILLWELLTGEIPYSQMTPLQAAVGVVQRCLRPSIPEDAHPKFANLIAECWHQDPEMRPNFSGIILALQEIASEVGPKQGPSDD